MPRKPRSSLESASARLRLPIKENKKPYWERLGPGLSLGYRRNDHAGSWSIRAADGGGGEWLKRIGTADDYEYANGKDVLSYEQAVAEARRLYRSKDDTEHDPSKPLSLDGALSRYEADLRARSANPYNAKIARCHLAPSLLSKPLALINADELKTWRDRLVGKGFAPSSVNRIRNNVRAALELSAPNRSHVWKTGLETLPNAARARKLIYPDDTIRALIAEAYRHDGALGLLCDVLAATGMRPIQAQRLRVEDLITGDKPRLMVSKTAKGGGRNRAEKKLQRYPVPITSTLCAKLKHAAKGRADDAPLLLQADGRPWHETNPSGDYRRPFIEIVKAVGLAPDVTAYVFRHSSIARMLMRGLHTKLVADLHDTSEQMIRQHYGKYIIEHTDEIARAALLDDEPPGRAQVVQI
ncbi:tyrosine-type recombinase/integrase [Bradyrhizobium sp. UFLA05-109]